ncbi:MAG: small multi-drug export protein [FCB group bacterium]|nr:small multi-drug export protein [FCB group bacterium]
MSVGIWALVLLALSVLRPRPFAGIWLVVVQQLLGGRALGIATALSLEIPKPFIILHCTLMDMLLIMVLYPLLVSGVRHGSRFRLLGKMIEGARKGARRYKKRLQRFGPAGLVVFVFAPVWGTGPMAGTVVGSLAEWSAWSTLSAVALGDLGAVTCWTFFFSYVQHFAGSYGRWLPVFLLVILLVAFLLSRVWRARSRKKGEPKPHPEPDSLHP